MEASIGTNSLGIVSSIFRWLRGDPVSNKLVCMATWSCMSVVAFLFVVRIVLIFCWKYLSEDVVAIGLVDCVAGWCMGW